MYLQLLVTICQQNINILTNITRVSGSYTALEVFFSQNENGSDSNNS